MAITKAIPTLWSAMLLIGFQRTNVWASLITDQSRDLIDGDTLKMISLTTDVTIGDYTGATIGAAQELTDAETELTIDQKKFFNIAVDDVDRVQSRPDLLMEFSNIAGRKISTTFDIWASGVWETALGASQKRALTVPLAATDAAAKALIADINLTVKVLEQAHWPLSETYIVFSPESSWVMRHFFTSVGVGSGVLDDSVFFNGMLTKLFGITSRVDPNAADVTNAGDSAVKFGTRDAMSYALQIAHVEPYRPESSFKDAIKGLYVYGGKVKYPTHRYALQKA